ncbi:MAG: helix-turn-helix domain-containing protein [Candidatus Nealsonbacteria bacterium]
MARLKDREKSLSLRKQGMSYSQIKKELKVGKSTLSLWLRDYPLSKKRIRELRDWNEQRIERCRETKRRKKEERLKSFYKEQKKIIFPLNKHSLFLAGLFLYWGEGSKSQFSQLSISNTDPSMIKFFIHWLDKILLIPNKKLKVQLHLYSDMNIKKEIKFWSETLNIPFNQFTKPYIKETSSIRINHKGGFGHGTCNIRISSARFAEKMHMAIKTISDKYQ